MSRSSHNRAPLERYPPRWIAVESLLIFVLLFLLAGTPPPDVNEVHYLAKAKQYWDPAWCQGDIFLESSDTHLVFYFVFGWPTRFLSLEATAWMGRIFTWALLAWSWQRLSTAVVPLRLMSVLTAALFSCLVSCFHMAGEWVVGGWEAKCLAYGLVFCGLRALVDGRWRAAWIWLGAASSVHVLVGGWSVIAAGLAWCGLAGDRPPLRRMWPALLVGLVLAMPGLVPALTVSQGVDAEVARAANQIQVFERLRHHLSFRHILLQPLRVDFEHLGVPVWKFETRRLYFLRHLLLVAGWLGLCWRLQDMGRGRRLHFFVCGACLISVCGILIDQATLWHPEWGAPLLRYYWFRLADVMVPVGAALAVGQWIQRCSLQSAVGRRCLYGALLVSSAYAADVYLRHRHDPRPRSVQQAVSTDPHAERRLADWRAACRWIAENAPRQAICLTPRYQQTFKWYAGRAEVANWKDAPQDAQTLLEWKRRMRSLYPPAVAARGLVAHGEDELLRLAREFGFRFLVVDRTRSRRALEFPRRFPAGAGWSCYEVYEIPAD